MEVSALKYSGAIGLHGRSRLLKLQSDERLIAFLRNGNTAAFEVLFGRYEARLLAFCRHVLGSREDAEDVLQEVMTAAFNAILADDRPINVRPWLYRIARNRSLNHVRRLRAVAIDSMDLHFSDNGASTADKVHDREEFRLLLSDIHQLPETQKTALVLREMDALSYDQIAEAMETTVPSVKSLLVRARVSLAEAAEARVLTCEDVRIELAEVAEGLLRRPSPLVRRHLHACKRCTIFRAQLKHTNKALAALLPIGPTVILKKLLIVHLSHSAGAGSSATAAGSGAAGSGVAGAGAAGAGAGAAGAGAGAAGVGAAGAGAAGAGGGAASVGAASVGAAGAGAGAAGTAGAALAGSTVTFGTGGFVSAGVGALAVKAAAGLAAAALVTGAAVEVDHGTRDMSPTPRQVTTVAAVPHPAPPAQPAQPASPAPLSTRPQPQSSSKVANPPNEAVLRAVKSAAAAVKVKPVANVIAKPVTAPPVTIVQTPPNVSVTPTGRTQNQTDPTVVSPTSGATPTGAAGTSGGTTTTGPITAPFGGGSVTPTGAPPGGTTLPTGTGPTPPPGTGGTTPPAGTGGTTPPTGDGTAPPTGDGTTPTGADTTAPSGGGTTPPM